MSSNQAQALLAKEQAIVELFATKTKECLIPLPQAQEDSRAPSSLNHRADAVLALSDNDNGQALIEIYQDFMDLINASDEAKRTGKSRDTPTRQTLFATQGNIVNKLVCLIHQDEPLAKRVLKTSAGQQMLTYLIDNSPNDMLELKTFIFANLSELPSPIASLFETLYANEKFLGSEQSKERAFSFLIQQFMEKSSPPLEKIDNYFAQDFSFLAELPDYLQLLLKVKLNRLLMLHASSNSEDCELLLSLLDKSAHFEHSLQARTNFENTAKDSAILNLATSLYATELYYRNLGITGIHTHSYVNLDQTIELMKCHALLARDQESLSVMELRTLLYTLNFCSLVLKGAKETPATLNEESIAKALSKSFVRLHALFNEQRMTPHPNYPIFIIESLELLNTSFVKHLSANDLYHFMRLCSQVAGEVQQKPEASIQMDQVIGLHDLACALRELEDLIINRTIETTLSDELSIINQELSVLISKKWQLPRPLNTLCKPALMDLLHSLVKRYSNDGDFLLSQQANSADIEQLYKDFLSLYKKLSANSKQLLELKTFLPYAKLRQLETLALTKEIGEIETSSPMPSPKKSPNKSPKKKEKPKKGFYREPPSRSPTKKSPTEGSVASSTSSSSPPSVQTTPTFFKPVKEEGFKVDVQKENFPEELVSFVHEINELGYDSLILIGGALTNLVLGEGIEGVADFDFVLPNVDLKILSELLNNQVLDNLKAKNISATVFGKSHQTLSITLERENAPPINIDINTCEKKLESTNQMIKRYLSQSVFKLSALFMSFHNGDRYQIFYSGGDKLTVSTNSIELMEDAPETFVENPLALFRLIKLSLKHPGLSYSDGLCQALNHFQSQTVFKDFLSVDKANGLSTRLGQTKTYLDNLFERFPVSELLEQLLATGLLESLTGIKNTELRALLYDESSLNYLKAPRHSEQRVAHLFYLILAYQLCKNPDTNQREWSFYKLIKNMRFEFKTNLEHIEQECAGKKTDTFFNLPELDLQLLRIKDLATASVESEAKEDESAALGKFT